MEDFKVYQEYGEELERRLRLKTFPLALKLLQKKEDIPEGAKRPLKDFGHHFSYLFLIGPAKPRPCRQREIYCVTIPDKQAEKREKQPT
jgi:hypothetical protein